MSELGRAYHFWKCNGCACEIESREGVALGWFSVGRSVYEGVFRGIGRWCESCQRTKLPEKWKPAKDVNHG